MSDDKQIRKATGLKRMAEALLIFVRGPIFLSVISLVLLLAIPAAQGTLLKGYLSSDAPSEPVVQAPPAESTKVAKNTVAGPEPAANFEQPAPGLVSDEDISPEDRAANEARAMANQPMKALASPAEAALNQRMAMMQKALVASNSFPTSFTGAWRCVTVVVNSGVNTIPVGQRVVSEVRFVPQRDGRVVAQWAQQGWSSARENIMPVSENEAELERTNVYTDQGAGGEWAARSLDHYIKLDANRIAASSDVEQFVSGELLGTYQTRSMLYRESGNMAYAD